MKKPTKIRRSPIHDYHKCRDYLQAKYGYDERDYLGHLGWSKRKFQELAPRYGVDFGEFYGKAPAMFTVNESRLSQRVDRLRKKEEPHYLDFWHWVLDNYEIHNGCEIAFSRDKLDEIAEPWVKEIYSRYIEEFADEDGELPMYVWW